MSIARFKQWSIRITCVLLYSFSTTVFTQNDTISAPNITTKAFKQSLEGKSLYKLVEILYGELNMDSLKSKATAKHIETNFLTSKNLKEVAGAYVTLTVWEDKRGNFDQAISLVDKGIAIANEIENDSILYLAYLRKGYIDYFQARHELALKSHYKALEIAEKEQNTKREIIVKSNIALVKMEINDVNGAIEVLLENLQKVKDNPTITNEGSILRIYLNLCCAYIRLEDFTTATPYCAEVATLNADTNDPVFEVHFLSAFAEIARSNKEFEKCYDLLDKAEVVMKTIDGKKDLRLFLKFYRAKAYYDEEKYQLAVAELLKVENMKDDGLKILSIQELYYYLAQSYVALGNIEQGVKYHDKAKKIDQENDEKRQKINANILKKFDLPELKRKIGRLEEQSKRTKYFYFTGIALLILVIIGLLTFNRKQQQKNKKRFTSLMQELEEKRQQEKLRQEKRQQDDETSMLKETSIETDTISLENSAQTEIEIDTAEIDTKDLEILKKLAEFEQKELFLSKESTLVEVAKKIQTNTTYLSKVINTHKEKSFTSYITDLRVEYAIERLSHDRKFRSFTIGAIAQEIGFKRSESFSKAFKIKTGLYPSYFIKEIEKQIDRDLK